MAAAVASNVACIRRTSQAQRWGIESLAFSEGMAAAKLHGSPQLVSARNHAVYIALALGRAFEARTMLRLVL